MKSSETQPPVHTYDVFLSFAYELRRADIPVSPDQLIELLRAFKKGLVQSMDDLYLMARLCFVKEVKYFDTYDRTFLYFFEGLELPPVAEGDLDLLETKQFQQWLRQAWIKGELPRHPYSMSPQELMELFWQRLREQTEAHHGGNKWIGTGGTSPFGHSGFSENGFRVMGQANRFSAKKVMGQRRYVDYSEAGRLNRKNFHDALQHLKHLKPAGAPDQLNIPESIRKTARNAGEIELIFEKDKRDRLEVILMMDNGGTSMAPYVHLTADLFQRMQKQLKKLDTYYFHNTIYSYVYSDPQRSRPIAIRELLRRNRDCRIFIVGDASMAPEELVSPYGNINFGEEEYEPSLEQLKKLANRFPAITWLNPIPREFWTNGSFTLKKIATVLPMEEMTLGGLERAVKRMNEVKHEVQ